MLLNLRHRAAHVGDGGSVFEDGTSLRDADGFRFRVHLLPRIPLAEVPMVVHLVEQACSRSSDGAAALHAEVRWLESGDDEDGSAFTMFLAGNSTKVRPPAKLGLHAEHDPRIEPMKLPVPRHAICGSLPLFMLLIASTSRERTSSARMS